MDDKRLELSLAEELIKEWDIIPTGTGFLITTDWHWPNDERIEVHVRRVGDREDLYLVSDGGDLFNFLFSQGIDLSKDARSMKIINGIAEKYGAKFAEYQIVKGAGEEGLAQAVRMILEAIKDTAYILWHKLDQARESIH